MESCLPTAPAPAGMAAAAETEMDSGLNLRLCDLLTVDLLRAACFGHMSLAVLLLFGRTSHEHRDWVGQALEGRGVTAVDVAAGVHVKSLRWLLARTSQPCIVLAAGRYLLGSIHQAEHVQAARPLYPANDPEDGSFDAHLEDWLNYEACWQPGCGPLVLARSVTLQAETPGSAALVLDANFGSGSVISVEGRVRVTLRGINVVCSVLPRAAPPTLPAAAAQTFLEDTWHNACDAIHTDGCSGCRDGCLCRPYGGSHLEVVGGHIRGHSFFEGRQTFDRCSFWPAEGAPLPDTGAHDFTQLTSMERIFLTGVHPGGCGSRLVNIEQNGRLSLHVTHVEELDGGSRQVLDEMLRNSWEKWDGHPFTSEDAAVNPFLGDGPTPIEIWHGTGVPPNRQPDWPSWMAAAEHAHNLTT